MKNTQLTIDLPVVIDAEEVKSMIFASLFGKGEIFSGKAASYLEIEKIRETNFYVSERIVKKVLKLANE